MTQMQNEIKKSLAAGSKFFALAALITTATAVSARADGFPGNVYAMTNAAANSIAVYERAPGGTLIPAGTYFTNGQGTGAGLGSQGAIALSDDGRWLVAVNAASNNVTVFAVDENGLQFRGTAASGGQTPISIAIHEDLVYVVNAGGTPNISGFRLHRRGSLEMIPGSTRPLTGLAPAQIGFSDDGDLLVVTEKGTNTIAIFRLDDGVPAAPTSMPSSGLTPFGFGFDKRDHLIVSEAFGAAAGATAVSSYDVTENGHLTVITGSLKSGQTAACWIAVNRKGTFAYSANTPSATITGYRVGRDGRLSLLNPSGISATLPAGSAPTDMAVTRNDQFLYTLNSGNGSVGAYRIAADGSLAFLGTVAGLPAGAVGLAAR
jgi:6-phosphogluconolactonase (cycloisomerase 2 family)